MFRDRKEAGERLAAQLVHLQGRRPVVLALPRGGVAVAFEIARLLGAPLDVVLVRKIGVPGQPELALGAVADGGAPEVFIDERMQEALAISGDYVREETARQLAELERRRKLYRAGRRAPAIEGRTVIVVDDGIATGGTAKAVLRALAMQKAGRVILAVPVAPSDALEELAPEADEVVCLASPEPFFAVGEHYRDFTQTTDEEVVDLLQKAAR